MGHRSDEHLAAAWHDLMGNYHRMICTLDRELQAEHGLTSSDFEVLEQLYAADGPTRMSELGDRVHLTQSALSRLISRLESDGLVQRAMCTDDRRSVMTEITAQGKARYQQARPTQRRILREQASGCIPVQP